MVWSDLRVLVPNQWVAIEAIKAHSANNHRILDIISIVEILGPDEPHVFERYLAVRRQFREREMYFVHTSNEQLDIEEIPYFGPRRRQVQL